MAPLRIWIGTILSSCALAGCLYGSTHAGWSRLLSDIGPQQKRAAASPPILSEHERQELDRMTPQQQAERLLERTTNHYQGARELIDQRVDSWRGSLRLAGALDTLLTSAFNSDDLRVRAAAIEVNLAAYNVEKTPESVFQRIHSLESEQGDPISELWILGLLGNRGVETERVFETLRKYGWDRDTKLRKWAVEGMALLGTEATIEPLLDIFHNDPSPEVRERAACSLAQSGMLEQAQRMKAVPALLNYLDDSSLDATTHQWVVQALQDISGRSVGDDSLAWRQWYSNR